MSPFDRCPGGGGELVEKQVEKLLRGGRNTTVIRVDALVCLKCGERLYDEAIARRFEEIRGKLERHETGEFQALGQSFQVA